MLQAQAENLWTHDYELKLSIGIPFPTRMTVVRLPDGSLCLVSPTPIDDALAADLAAIGPVGHVISPNLLHHLHLPALQKRYPEARILAASGIAAKQPSLRFESLPVEEIPALRDTLAGRTIEGAPKISEMVLYHAPSRSLLVADLVFNIETPPSWSTSALLRMMGAHGRLAQSRAWNALVKDAPAARASCERLFDWDFDRIVVGHGSIVETDGKQRLRAALTRTGNPARAPALAGA